MSKYCNQCSQTLEHYSQYCPQCGNTDLTTIADAEEPSLSHVGSEIVAPQSLSSDAKPREQSSAQEDRDWDHSPSAIASGLVGIEVFAILWLHSQEYNWSTISYIIIYIVVTLVFNSFGCLRFIMSLAFSIFWGLALMDLSPIIFSDNDFESYIALFKILAGEHSWEYFYMGILGFGVSLCLHES